MTNNFVHIINKAIKGDQKAQRLIYDQYRHMWYMISMRYGKDRMQADDIMQEGLIRIYNDLHQYDINKSQFSTWSSRVLINAALRYLKKSNWHDTLLDLDHAAETPEENNSIFNQLAAKEMTEMIQKLPIGYRIVFNMYAVEGYTHKEIAEQLGIAEGTSKSQLSKARVYLRKELESHLKISQL